MPDMPSVSFPRHDLDIKRHSLSNMLQKWRSLRISNGVQRSLDPSVTHHPACVAYNQTA